MSIALSLAQHRLQQHSARRIPGRHLLTRCGVAVVLAQGEVIGKPAEAGTHVLLMRRAIREGDPWSGDMSFPGGRCALDERYARSTAARELQEETGLDIAEHGQYVARLSDVVTRKHEANRPMVVSPYVWRLQQAGQWQMNHEAVELVWLPLGFLADSINRQMLRFRIKRLKMQLPCYYFESCKVWGLTLLMLDELVAVTHARPKQRRMVVGA